MSHGLILYSLKAQVFILTPVSPIQAQDGDNVTLHWDYHSGFHTLGLAQWGGYDLGRYLGNHHLFIIELQRPRVCDEQSLSFFY